MVPRPAIRAPVVWLTLFVAVAAIPLVAIGWLGWRVLHQDEAIEQQGLRDRLDSAASLTAREIDRVLTSWADRLPRSSGDTLDAPPHTSVFVFDEAGVLDRDGILPAYYPRIPTPASAPAQLFSDAEAHEFRERNLAKAVSSYRALAASSNRLVRAAALVRLARVLRQQRQWREALTVYEELAALDETLVAGSPAELVARRERVILATTIGDAPAAARERALLASALAEGRFRLDRPTFEFFRTSVNLPGDRFAPTEAAMTVARVVDAFWPRWHERAEGRAAVADGTTAFVAVWRPSSSGTAALVGRVADLVVPAQAVARDLRVRLLLADSTGRPLWGDAGTETDATARTFRDATVPWSIHVALADTGAHGGQAQSRRRVFVAGFALLVLIVAAAGYFVFRAVHRELSVAALQSDFVAAVSHEFRTPLTAMCHLTEMLEDGQVEPARLPHYYGALGRESRRLHAMVEKLLDFGRIDAGRRDYDLVETDAATLVTQVVEQCREQAPSIAHRLEWHSPSASQVGAVTIRADRDALALALRNLLDNAAKYSSDSTPVRISVGARGRFVGISVEDQGVGISHDEQRTIFRKFARGSAARALNVKGTGIGLTMAAQIVRAHGGRLELDSQPGHGSRFTALLPAVQSHA